MYVNSISFYLLKRNWTNPSQSCFITAVGATGTMDKLCGDQNGFIDNKGNHTGFQIGITAAIIFCQELPAI